MKILGIVITASLVLILSGFLYLKKGESQTVSVPTPTPELNYELSSYIDYSPGVLSAAQQKGTTVLFFAATGWCQTCSELDKEILERVREIPEDVTILKVDYDNEKALNKQYYVTAQHTLIVFDQAGQEKTRWLGGDFDQLLTKIHELK